MGNIKIVRLIVGVLVILGGFMLDRQGHKFPQLANLKKQLEDKMHPLELELELLFKDELLINQAIKNNYDKETLVALEAKEYTLLLYENDSLIFWTKNAVLPFEFEIRSYLSNSPERISSLLEVREFQYQMIRQNYTPAGDSMRYTMVGLIPIRLKYAVENDYLKELVPLKPELSGVLDFSNVDDNYSLQDVKGEHLVFLNINPDLNQCVYRQWVLLLYVIGILFVILFLDNQGRRICKQYTDAWGVAFMLLSVITLRVLWLYFHFPDLFEESEVLGQQMNVGFSGTTLGDFMINVLLLFWLVVFTHRELRIGRSRKIGHIRKYLIAFCAYTIVFGSIFVLNHIFRRLILDTEISFDVNNVIALDNSSVLGLLGLALLIFSVFLISQKLMSFVAQMKLSLQVRRAFLITLLLIFVLYNITSLSSITTLLLLLCAAVYVISFESFVVEKEVSFAWLATWLVFFAAFTSSLLYNYNKQKGLYERKDYAQKIALEHDLNTENVFCELSEEILSDQFIQNYFSSLFIRKHQVKERLNTLYLDKEFFTSHQYEVFIFKGNKRFVDAKAQEFERLRGSGEKGVCPEIVLISEPNGWYYYLAKFDFVNQSDTIGSVYIQLIPKTNKRNDVYLELLNHGELESARRLKDYDCALYKKGRLAYSEGGNYPASLPFGPPKGANFMLKEEKESGREFVAFKSPRGYVAIVGKDKDDWIRPISLFSYLFCFLLIVLVLLIFLNRLIRILPTSMGFHLEVEPTLSGKIQTAVISIILVSFVTIGIVTIVYFQQEYTDYHKERLKRKIQGVSSTAAYQMEQLNKNGVEVLPDVSSLAEINRLVVNLYDLGGNLIESSKETFFDRKLISKQMHPLAFFAMQREGQSRFIQGEQMGNFKYQAAYVPLKNKQNSTIAYLNIPYDSENSNLRTQDVAAFLVTLLNVYVLLLLVAGAVAIFIARSITSPLSFISDKLRSVQLGKKNEPLEWEADDEIGTLVTRYNNMIKQLEESTMKLAQSQKESAWREMAKQVAHEIKNPLTPMKLNIQLLQRALQSDPERAKEMSSKVARTLIEQIDNLSHIASEFSNFAKMPQANNEALNLNQLVSSVFDLFSKNQRCKLSLMITDEECAVFADRNQLMRVLNNIIKNAIQAIPEGQLGEIHVALQKKDMYAVVSVEDNGVGIPEDKQLDVFIPNFTTKSSGTGLGLAMSKNIVEMAKGKIYFESRAGKGTVFFVELPLIVTQFRFD